MMDPIWKATIPLFLRTLATYAWLLENAKIEILIIDGDGNVRSAWI